MNSISYRFQVGVFECIVVSDGSFSYPNPAALLFPSAPRERLGGLLQAYAVQPDGWQTWVSPYSCLIIYTGPHRVLVDTGAGRDATSTGRRLQSLRAEGIEPEYIDTIILSHGHADHIGGATDETGRPVFPRARYVMLKEEWDFWTSECNLAAQSPAFARSARANLPPLRRQLDLVEPDTEIVRGVWAVAAPGHTPGHLVLVVASGAAQLLYLADSVLHPLHVEQPDWSPALDLAPDQAAASRRCLLDRAAAERALVHAYHFPFPGVGFIISHGDGWRWQPDMRAVNRV